MDKQLLEAKLQQVVAHYRTGNYVQALSELDDYENIGPVTGDCFRYRSIILTELEKYEEALKAHDLLLNKDDCLNMAPLIDDTLGRAFILTKLSRKSEAMAILAKTQEMLNDCQDSVDYLHEELKST